MHPTDRTLSWTHPLFDRLLKLAGSATAPHSRLPTFTANLYHHQLVSTYLRSGHPSLETIEPETKEKMIQGSQSNTHFILSMLKPLKAVAQTLNEHRIRYLLYKGATLAKRIFGDIAARQFGDIDLLIHPNDFFPAFDRLRQTGFFSTLPVNPFIETYLKKSRRDAALSKDHLRLDLHQQIARGPNHFMLPETTWSQLETIDLYDHPYPVLDVESELVLLSVHAARHGWDHYKLLLDLAGLFNLRPHLDWDRISRLVVHHHSQAMFTLGLRLVQTVFPELVTPPALSIIDPTIAPTLSYHIQVLDQGRKYSDLAMLKRFFHVQNGHLNRIKMALFYFAYPRPEDPMLLRFNKPIMAHLLPILHPIDLVFRHLQPKRRSQDRAR